eukprot:CAMPEP_0179174568 /NCGR_PEP_ID=MMETSP0796-20121207/86188_1 /TAXON_ID=73915 /ORGANISM="Pyrodinium bahamense, Strain pbaha01" /LENGTH=169 /DNA_ID=CAMNT_0020877865 /DNA_START=106 /DNA_END=612 /DNA_ORIENTATION=+
MSPPTSYRASRYDMMKRGVPNDYVDALLDDRYMQELIEQTNQRINSRAGKLQRYFFMQRLIFYILCVQAVVGVFVALFKTLWEPDVIFKSDVVTSACDEHPALCRCWLHRHVVGRSAQQKRGGVQERDGADRGENQPTVVSHQVPPVLAVVQAEANEAESEVERREDEG